LIETIARFLDEPSGDRRKRRTDPGFQTCHLSVKVQAGMAGVSAPARDAGEVPAPPWRLHGSEADRPPGQKRLLVVDDDPSVREMLGRVLVGEGYAVREAADGATAIEIAGAAQCDLVLLDLGLPGTSGWDTLERLTATSPAMPIIIITGRSHQVLNALAAGVQALIQKPLDFARLLQTIQVLLGESPPTRTARLTEERAERLDR
jgi:CheY-like chemotaxis protein